MDVTEPPCSTLPEQIERVRDLATAALRSPDDSHPPALTSALFDFHAMTRDARYLEDAGETARSLATLLHHGGDGAPGEQERPQIVVLLNNLLHELSPESKPLSLVTPPLVTPIAPSAATRNPRVALFVDSGTELVMLRETLRQEGFEAQAVDSLEALSTAADDERPVAIIADLALCRLQPRCGEIFAALRRRFSPPPHLFFVAPSTDIAARLEAVRLGATRFLPQPVDVARLLAILKGVTRRTPTPPFRVVLVEDDSFHAEYCREAFADSGIVVLVVNDPLQAPARIAEFVPDLVVCDLFMPGCNGLELLALLRQDDALVDTPIVLISSEQDIERQLEALNLGADGFLTKPVDPDLLIATVVARGKRARMLKRSRGEYRRLQARVRELEACLPEGAPEMAVTDADAGQYFIESIDLDDYVVGEFVPPDGTKR